MRRRIRLRTKKKAAPYDAAFFDSRGQQVQQGKGQLRCKHKCGRCLKGVFNQCFSASLAPLFLVFKHPYIRIISVSMHTEYLGGKVWEGALVFLQEEKIGKCLVRPDLAGL